MAIESIPIYAEQMIRRPDSNFFSFKVNTRFYVLYDKKKAAKEDKGSVSTVLIDYLDDTGSIFISLSPISPSVPKVANAFFLIIFFKSAFSSI